MPRFSTLLLSGTALIACSGHFITDIPKVSWHIVNSFPVERGLSGSIAGISNGTLLLIGGSNFSHPILEGGKKKIYDDIYIAVDADHPQWQHVGKFPYALTDAVTVSFDDGLFVLGGTDGIMCHQQVSFVSWKADKGEVSIDTSYPDLPKAMSGLSAARIGDDLYVVGGREIDGTMVHDFWKLHLSKETPALERKWEPLPAWPGPARAGASLVVQHDGENEKLFLFGGKGVDYYDDAYVFDVVTGTWEVLPTLPRPAYFSNTLAVGQDYILLFSGSDGHDAANAIALREKYQMVNDAYAYHTETKSWTKIDTIPVGVAGAATVKWKDHILLIGGELRPGVRANFMQIGKYSL